MRTFLSLLFAMACVEGNSQQAIAAADSTPTALSSAVDYYYQFTHQRSRLYNGKEFIPYDPSIEGHPYFGVDVMTRGTIVYDDMFFDQVNMQYDIVKDQVLIQHFDVFFKVVLIPEKVDEFTILGHKYKKMVKDSTGNFPFSSGYYDFMHEGSIKLLVKRTKTIEETITDKINKKIKERNFYYILKDDKYNPVRSLRGLLSILSEQSKPIRQELRKKGLKFRRDREQTILAAVQYYDLSNK